MTHLVIIADDLTGAADTGAAFAEAGFSTAIPLGGMVYPPADVVVLSTESRDLDAIAAAEAVRNAILTYLRDESGGGPRWVYKKIDSALRGHPREELLALMDALGETRAVVAPAFPAEGRTTLAGRQYIDGVPVEASALGTSETPWNLVAVFRNDRGVPVRLINLAMLRGRPQLTQRLLSGRVSGIVISDAMSDADLLILARAVAQSRSRILCGSAGFARQLVRTLPLPAAERSSAVAGYRFGPVLVVAGSRHEATVRQIAALQQSGFPVIELTQELVDDAAASIAPLVTEVADHLTLGRAVALTTRGLRDSPLGQSHVSGLLARVVAAPGVSDRIGGLVLTGGAVAAAVCAALDAAALRLDGEIVPGLPWGLLEGGVASGALVATKAGSFGDEQALLTCIERLTAAMPEHE